jgi:hypothetical protein
MRHLSPAPATVRVASDDQIKVNEGLARRRVRARLYTVQSCITPEKSREESMQRLSRRAIPVLAGLALLGPAPPARGRSGDRSVVSKPGWQRLGHQQRQPDQPALFDAETDRHKQRRAAQGAWMTRLKGSGFGGKYSFETTPLVKDGVMYVITGNDDVFALNGKDRRNPLGALVEYRPENQERVLRARESRFGNGRGHVVSRPVRRQCCGAGYQDR